MRLFHKYFKNNRGATSVLIMIMMIILMIFGLAALTTSAASRKLAQKNATWLKEYYVLQGKAEIAYAHLVEALNLPLAGHDADKVETALVKFLKNHSDCSFQKNADEDMPFLIEMKVQEQGKEVPKNIQMEFAVVKEKDSFAIKVQKWSQYQEEIFDENDEIRFTEIIRK